MNTLTRPPRSMGQLNDGTRALWALASLAGTAAGAFHGYRRNDSVGWGVWWALMGGLFPIVTVPIAVAQGFGEPEYPEPAYED